MFPDFLQVVYRFGDGHRLSAWSQFFGRASNRWMERTNLRTIWMRMVGRRYWEERLKRGLPCQPLWREVRDRLVQSEDWEVQTCVGDYPSDEDAEFDFDDDDYDHERAGMPRRKKVVAAAPAVLHIM
ncbi:unnamed protein product [Parascedosporium putredinis]|uniref:Uncharacterized protein n=1 Tax=Parascedosporium putredinis TaxID=1442378 RepID=A0A9P1H7Q6_9PEZI|nr:unnamed protein product [Parascedosporium putredinis]CAI8000066.1 unnamed protein product [Parascedosporium putredinis]